MGMQSRDRQQHLLRRAPQSEENPIDAQPHHAHPRGREAMVAQHVDARGFGTHRHCRGQVRRHKQQHAPNGRSNQRKCSGWRLCCISWKTVTAGHGQYTGAVKPGLYRTSSWSRLVDAVQDEFIWGTRSRRRRQIRRHVRRSRVRRGWSCVREDIRICAVISRRILRAHPIGIRGRCTQPVVVKSSAYRRRNLRKTRAARPRAALHFVLRNSHVIR